MEAVVVIILTILVIVVILAHLVAIVIYPMHPTANVKGSSHLMKMTNAPFMADIYGEIASTIVVALIIGLVEHHSLHQIIIILITRLIRTIIIIIIININKIIIAIISIDEAEVIKVQRMGP